MRARLLPLIKKEFIQIFRTKPMLGFIFVAPIIQTLLMGYAVTTQVTRLPTIICDEEHSQFSRELTQILQQTEYFDVVELTSAYPRIRWAMDEGSATVGLIIPPDFTRKLRTGLVPNLQVILDGSNSNTAMVALGYLQQIAADYSRQLGREYVNDFFTYGTASPPVAITPTPRVWYNPNFVNAYFMVP
ncbi:MAG: ABC transporter permease, partial [Calditrichota bacterium]